MTPTDLGPFGEGRRSVPTTLVGRDHELDAVRAFVTSVTAGGRSLLLSGEAGVGKTALLAAAHDHASAAGVDVVRVTGVEFDATPSFFALGRILLPLRQHFAGLDGGQQRSLQVALGLGPGAPPRREVLCAATLSVLHHAAGSGPLLLVADDAQWLDPASAAVLAFVGRRLGGAPVGLLAAMRTESSSPLAEAGLPGWEVKPLGEQAARSLITERYPALAPRVRARVLKDSRRNPLALRELPAALTSAQRAGTSPLPAVLPVGTRLSGVFGSRVKALPPRSRAVLLVAALEGRSGDLGVIQVATPEDPGLRHLAAAEQSGIVQVDDVRRRVEFSHPLARYAVVEGATTAERRAAHLALAGAYENQPGRRAWHLAEASDGPDEEIATLLERQAAAALAAGDTLGAVSALHRAADLSTGYDNRARRQVQAAFIGADVTGDLVGAAKLLQDAHQIEPAVTHSLAATVAASYLLLNSECDVDTAHRLLVGAIEKHPGRYDGTDPVLEAALHSLLMVSWFGGRQHLWEPFERAVARLGPGVPPLVDLCHRTFGDPAHRGVDALPSLSETLAGLDAELDPISITRVGLAGVYTDRLGACRAQLWRVIGDGRDGGAVALAINALVSSCVDDWLTGQWDEAVRLSTEGMRLCEVYGYRRYSVILGGYIDQLVKVARGDLEGGRAAADDMSEWAVAHGAGMSGIFAEHLRTLRAAALGDYEAAYRHASTISPAGHLPPYAPHALWVLFDLVEAAARTGRDDKAAAHVAEMHRLHISRLSPRLHMLTAGSAAISASDADAGRLFAEALDVPDGRRWPFDRARIQLCYGEWLRTRGSIEAARLHLREALSSFAQLGAEPWTLRAADQLRATGEPARRPQPQANLTPRELQIAQLAALGLTNRQIGERLFMSHRSVGAALYRLFPKLGITSRAALHDALHRLGAPGPTV